MKSPRRSVIGKPAAYEYSDITLWIRRLLSLTDWAPSRMASAAGLAPSTINRFLSDSRAPLLSATTLGKIEVAAYNRFMERVRAGEISAEDIWTDEHYNKMAYLPDRDRLKGNEWGFPETWFRFVMRTEPGQCFVATIDDKSAAPDLHEGDFVIVDSKQKHVTSGGMYLLRDGSRSIVRRRPKRGARIEGRVIGMFRKM